MATFQQRENGKWQAKIRRKGWPDESKTFRTKTEAHNWAQQVEADIGRGIYQSASEAERTTLGDLIKRFETEFAPHHYRSRADQKEAWRFQCARLNEVLGEYSLAAIDQRLITRFRDERITPPIGCSRQAVSESTTRKELYMLSKLLGFAEAECGITLPRGNPVERIRMPPEGKARDRRLTPDEWSKLDTECRNSGNRLLHPALIFAVETAIRQGEMLNLQWQNIDFKRRIAYLPITKNGEARAVPLTTKAVETLRTLSAANEGPVLPVERMTLYHAFVAACKRANIEDYDWHDLRHEALSRLAERGDMSVLELAAISGHKTLQVLKRYTHLQAENLAKKLG